MVLPQVWPHSGASPTPRQMPIARRWARIPFLTLIIAAGCTTSQTLYMAPQFEQTYKLLQVTRRSGGAVDLTDAIVRSDSVIGWMGGGFPKYDSNTKTRVAIARDDVEKLRVDTSHPILFLLLIIAALPFAAIVFGGLFE